MEAPANRTARRTGSEHPGPPLGAPAILFASTFVVSIALGPLTGAGATPSPYADPGRIAGYFNEHGALVASSSALMLVSAWALVIFAALVFARLTFLAPNAPGPILAGFGGLSAAGLLMISGIGMWSLARTGRNEDGVAQLLHVLDFAAGGPVHTALIGVMSLGVAVTTLYLHRTPRVLSIIGLVLAGIDVTALAALPFAALTPVVPLGRFLTISWLVAMALLIPRTRGARRPNSSRTEGE